MPHPRPALSRGDLLRPGAAFRRRRAGRRLRDDSRTAASSSSTGGRGAYGQAPSDVGTQSRVDEQRRAQSEGAVKVPLEDGTIAAPPDGERCCAPGHGEL